MRSIGIFRAGMSLPPILVLGGPCSGKTSLCQQLKKLYADEAGFMHIQVSACSELASTGRKRECAVFAAVGGTAVLHHSFFFLKGRVQPRQGERI